MSGNKSVSEFDEDRAQGQTAVSHSTPAEMIPYRGIPMTRLLLIMLFFLSSGPVFAEWVEVASTIDGMTAYADPATIRRKGDLVKMWYFWDYNTIQTVAGNSFLSEKDQSEFDCAEERTRLLAVTKFSGNMGRGQVVYSLSFDSAESKWIPVSPQSIEEALWKFACRKK